MLKELLKCRGSDTFLGIRYLRSINHKVCYFEIFIFTRHTKLSCVALYALIYDVDIENDVKDKWANACHTSWHNFRPLFWSVRNKLFVCQVEIMRKLQDTGVTCLCNKGLLINKVFLGYQPC